MHPLQVGHRIFVLFVFHLFVFLLSFIDLVLKDKIVVYDLAGQRIGWANYDCKFHFHIFSYKNLSSYVRVMLILCIQLMNFQGFSISWCLQTQCTWILCPSGSSVNVSETTSTGNTELFNAARVDSSSSHINQCKLMKNSILACFLQMAIFCVFTTFMTPREWMGKIYDTLQVPCSIFICRSREAWTKSIFHCTIVVCYDNMSFVKDICYKSREIHITSIWKAKSNHFIQHSKRATARWKF